MEKRDNNFTTAEIKRFAKYLDDFTPIEFNNWNNVETDELIEKRLKQIADDNNWKYEETPYEWRGEERYEIIEFEGLSTEERVSDLERAISILGWKLLYERKKHKAILKEIKKDLHIKKPYLKDITKRVTNHIDSDVDTNIKKKDDEDYYD